MSVVFHATDILFYIEEIMPIATDPVNDNFAGATANASAPNYLQVVADFSQAAWNTVGSHIALNVSGVCRLRVWAAFTSQLVAGGDTHTRLSLSCNGYSLFAAVTEAATTNEMWLCQGGSDKYAAAYAAGGMDGAIVDCVVSNVPVLLEVSLNALLSGGLKIHCVWEPMTPGAMVTAGDGSA